MPAAFCDLPADEFPFTIRARRVDNQVVVWEVDVFGPGAIEVPPLKQIHGVEVDVEIEPYRPRSGPTH